MTVVKQIDHLAIFERAAGHPARAETRTVIIVKKADPARAEFDQNHTLNGLKKPGGFAITPTRREQFFI